MGGGGKEVLEAELIRVGGWEERHRLKTGRGLAPLLNTL
jgi:hypothetical protein